MAAVDRNIPRRASKTVLFKTFSEVFKVLMDRKFDAMNRKFDDKFDAMYRKFDDLAEIVLRKSDLKELVENTLY